MSGGGQGAVVRWVRLRGPRGAVRLGRVLGRLEEPGVQVQLVRGDLFGQTEDDGPPVPLSAWTLLPPVLPSKVVGIGSNYRDHAAEMGSPLPPVPKIFLKPGTSVVGPLQPIRLPPGTVRVDHEAELAVVVGRTMSRVPAERALEHVLGFTCVNDVTARDFQRADGTFTRGKGFDSFCPLGPCIATGLDPGALAVRCEVDGELRQDGNTRDLLFGLAELLAFASAVMTLLPGDVLSTGTPAGVGPLRAGQRVVVEVEGIGRLENPVVDRDDRLPPGRGTAEVGGG